MLFFLLLICMIIIGCDSTETPPSPPYKPSTAEIVQATNAAQREIEDKLAVVPSWYRCRCRPDWRLKWDATGPIEPYANPIPLWRIMAICVVFMPLLVAVIVTNHNEPERWLGKSLLALVIPWIYCLPIDLVFWLLAYGFTGKGYYLPWHFIPFCLYAIWLFALTVFTIKPLICLMRSDIPIKATLGFVGLLLEIASHVFTIREIINIACRALN